jgi:uncharacterized protein
MTTNLRNTLIEIAKKEIKTDDPAHDILHTLRVLANAEYIAGKEGGDLDIVIPGALFHDLVTYEKTDPRNKFSVSESATKTEKILKELVDFPQDKIERVKSTILSTSFTYGKQAENLEDEIVQASDMLEAVGAISIMRTFSSSGKMNRVFYDVDDPFGEHRDLDDMKYSIDLFYTRLLKIKDRIKTKTAKKIAERRTVFLTKFLEEFRDELQGK